MNPTPARSPPPAEAGAARYAVYWAPEDDDPLWRAGCDWLGRDARTTPAASLHPGARPHTADPARYGFHATLKAPIRLAPGFEVEALLKTVQALSTEFSAFDMPALQVAWQGRFLALRPSAPLPEGHPLPALARTCVIALEAFRRPPSAAELARRRSAGLTPEEDARLLRWGYPHVLEGWQFHMTLSESWADPQAKEARALAAEAEAHFAAALRHERRCSSLWVCEERSPGADFLARWRFAFGGRDA